ncbi:amino acid transporter AVT6E-like [Rutidosis leptorrhynchoides]|uniref:amino acid transporter AVT6E-like n=1 Tax=Rutidosis leptorrhynchoides TaxID=125765 RepID=UPI003A9A5863
MDVDEKATRMDTIRGKKDPPGDDDDMDYPNNTSSGMYGAVFNLTTTIVGAGIMALPATMKVLGLIVGMLLIFLMGVISEISLEMLVRFTVLCKASSYGGVVKEALGSPFRIICEVFIVINNAGILVVYLIIIGDVMSGTEQHEGVLGQWFGKGFWDDRAIVIFIVLIMFLAPLCALDRIESLAMTSAASVLLAVLFVIIACFVCLIMLFEGRISMPRLLPDFGSKEAIIDLLVVIPIMSNAYVCHFNAQPIYNELEGRSPKKMNNVGRITTAICVAIYLATAMSGYLLFGSKTEADVLTNFDQPLGIRFSTALNYIIRIGYIFHLILVFPVIHFSLRQNVDALIFSGKKPLTESKTRCLGLTCVLLAFTYIASTLIPTIWVAFKFTGATTAVSLGFTFPALIGLRLNYMGVISLSSRERVLCWAMLILALIVSVVGVGGNLYGLS